MRSKKTKINMAGSRNLFSFHRVLYSLKQLFRSRDLLFIFLLIILFTLYKLFFLYQKPDLLWDEVVYVGISNYIYSFFQQGFYEAIRPIGLPLFIGVPFLFGASSNQFFAHFISYIFVIGLLIILFYLIKSSLPADKKPYFNSIISFIVVLCFLLNPLFLWFSPRILTSVPALFFLLLSFFFFKKKDYYLTGAFAGISFLFRYPFGLSLIIYFLMIFFRISKVKDKILSFLRVFFSFFMFVAFNLLWNLYHAYDMPISLFTKLFGPFLNAQTTVAQASLLESSNILYYIRSPSGYDVLSLFALFGLIIYLFKRQTKDSFFNFSLLSLFLLFAYFTFNPHKELRYALSFLPFLYVFLSIFLYYLFTYLRSRTGIVISMILVVFAILVSSLIFYYGVSKEQLELPRLTSSSGQTQDAFESLLYLSDKKVLSTIPHTALFRSKGVDYSYYNLLENAKRFELDESYYLFIFSPSTFLCPLEDYDCDISMKRTMLHLLDNFNVVFDETLFSVPITIFSRDPDIKPVKEESMYSLYGRYNIARPPELSKVPGDYPGIIILREGGVGDREKDSQELFKQGSFVDLNSFLVANDVPVTWEIIPGQFLGLSDDNKYFLSTFFEDNKDLISIAQLGYEYKDTGLNTEFEGLPYSAQEHKITQGKDILEENFNTHIISFVPPFNNADTTTSKVLSDKGFQVISSGEFDIFDSYNLSRFDVALFMIEDWSKISLKSSEQLIAESRFYANFNPYIILDFQHFHIDTVEKLDNFRDFILTGKEEFLFMNLDELYRWDRYLSDLNFSSSDNLLIIGSSSDISKYTPTIYFYSSNNMTLNTKLDKLGIKNMAKTPINICLNNDDRGCLKLYPKEYALLKISR